VAVPPKKGQAGLQFLYDVFEPLVGERPDEHMPAVGEDHNERPDRRLATSRGVCEDSETSEVHLSIVAGRGIGETDRRFGNDAESLFFMTKWRSEV
jgi:hypothetical protein